MSSFNNLFQNRFSYKSWLFFWECSYDVVNEPDLQVPSGDGSDTCKRKMRTQLLACSTTGEKPTGLTYRVRQHWWGTCCQEGCLWGHRWGILAFWHEGPQGCTSSLGNQPLAALQQQVAGTDALAQQHRRMKIPKEPEDIKMSSLSSALPLVNNPQQTGPGWGQ